MPLPTTVAQNKSDGWIPTFLDDGITKKYMNEKNFERTGIALCQHGSGKINLKPLLRYGAVKYLNLII